MAGIGFRLQKELKKDTYLDAAKAYLYSALIVSGPWILSIVTLASLSAFSSGKLDYYQILFFRTIIIYIFAFSLIVSGFLYLSLSRYLSDKLYLKEEEAISPIFNSAASTVLLIQGITGFLFFNSQGIAPFYVALSTMIYMVISMLWLVLIFLTALRDYNAVVISYSIGTLLILGISYVLSNIMGLKGYFLGYFLGNFVILILLITRIFIEFPSRRAFDMEFFLFLRNNLSIVLTGIFYNIAIWIDKMVFWCAPNAISVSAFMKTFPLYDGVVFVAYMTIIPALSVFMVEVETDFYLKYKEFFTRVVDKGTYSEIQQAKMDMAESLRKSWILVLLMQGGISFLAITFAPEIGSFFNLQPVQIPIFRITVLGAYLHSMLLIAIITILYFDLKKIALLVCLTYMLTNGVFTYITSFMDMPFMGYGYFFSSLLTLALAFYIIDSKFKKLEYITFAFQPLAVHREEEIG